jgi:hypothetical protein
VRVGSQRFIAEVSCPTHSRGCRVVSSATVVLGRAGGTITLRRIAAKLKDGATGWFAFVPTPTQRARLRSYFSRHGRTQLRVIVRFAVRDGNGTNGTQTFTYAASRVLDLTRL